MKELKYIVVGTGRCGTVFYARLLTSLGLFCGHETFFDYQDLDGALDRLSGKVKPKLSDCSQLYFDGKIVNPVDPYLNNLDDLVADSSYMAAPHLNHDCLKNTSIIHVVRNPIKVVNSFVNYLSYFNEPPISIPPVYEPFIYKYLPQLRQYEAPLDRAAMYYVLWNEMIEKREVIGRFKSEDGPAPIMKTLNLEGKPFDNRKINTFEKPGDRFDLNMLSKGEVKEKFIEIGKRYGYNMSSEYLLI